MAVRIRMKKLGRKHRPFFRIVAIDGRQPRDGRTLEELGTYDPMVKDKDARVIFDPERIKYWVSKGAKPSEAVAVFMKKYMKKFEDQAAAKVAEAQAAAAQQQPAPPANEPPAAPAPGTGEPSQG